MNSESDYGPFVVLGVGLILVAIYLLPTFIAWNKRNATPICVLNVLLGWTFVGWVVALVWACYQDAPQPPDSSEVDELRRRLARLEAERAVRTDPRTGIQLTEDLPPPPR